jgi:coenzyme F420 hydrogenase subunit delta
MDEILPDHCAKDVVVLCCGNVLFGDDGFGPAVAARLNAGDVPEWAVVIDAGTGVRELLFDMVLSERRPQLVIVVDAVQLVSTRESGDAPEPGEVFEIPLDRIPKVQVSEFSVHQAPTSNLLQELHDLGGIRVVVIVCQVSSIPEEMTEEMSPAVETAVEQAASTIAERFLREPVGAPPPQRR